MSKLLARIFPFSFLAAILALVLSVNFSPGGAQSCNSNGFICLNCSTAQICVGGSPLGSPFPCPSGAFCDPNAAFECAATACPTFTCTTAGRFPDPFADNKYFLCIPNGSGGFITASMTCPTGSKFNSTSAQCSLIPTTTTTTTTPATTTTTTTATTATTTTTVATTTPIYPCTAVGRFPDTTNCSNYFMCQINAAGGYFVYKYTCPRTTLFSPSVLKCVLSASSGCVVAG